MRDTRYYDEIKEMDKQVSENSNKLWWSSFKLLKPSKLFLVELIFIYLLFITICLCVGYNEFSMEMLVKVLVIFWVVYSSTFGMVFGIFVYLSQYLDIKLLDLLVKANKDGKKSEIVTLVNYYVGFLYVYLTGIFSTVFLIILSLFMGYIVDGLEIILVCKVIASGILSLYFVYTLMALKEIKSLIYNTRNLLRYKIQIELWEKHLELNKETDKKEDGIQEKED